MKSPPRHQCGLLLRWRPGRHRRRGRRRL